MKIAICDDDKIITNQLEKYILDYFKKSRLPACPIDTYASGEALLASPETYDMIFLDIEMPGLSGIFVGQELKSRNPDVIIFIVTSFAEYLDDAMRFHVFRYLSKPIDKDRLYRNFRDALALYTTLTQKTGIEMKQGLKTVFSHEIICVEAKEHRVFVHTTLGSFEAIRNMNYWEHTLPENCFFRTHRSFIVNMQHVTEFDHDLIHLHHGQMTAYLTRRKYTEFKDRYLLFLEGSSC